MAPSIDVVIVARDRYELTESCLRHLAAQTVAHQAVLVDNGSGDGTATRVREAYPQVAIVAFDEGRGFAEACNRGADAGDGEIVVLLNNDVDCEPDFLERLTAPFAADPVLGSVASLMLAPGGQAIDSVGLVADRTLAGFPRLHGQAATDAFSPRPVLTGPAGAGGAYRRTAWTAVGGMDEGIFAYMEDLDIALRLRGAGWGTVAAVDARGIHLGSASHGHRSASQRRHGGFARGYLLRRYGLLRGYGSPRTLTTEAIVVLGDLVISRDLAALRGRVAGWRSAAGASLRAMPPADAIDSAITFRRSLALRRGVYDRTDA
jgi:GT2 family glycosyltransferase